MQIFHYLATYVLVYVEYMALLQLEKQRHYFSHCRSLPCAYLNNIFVRDGRYIFLIIYSYILFIMVLMYQINRTSFYVYIYCISFQKSSLQKIMRSTSLQLSIITILYYFFPLVIIFLSLYCYNSKRDNFITIHNTIICGII